jgi:hypothetical protein
MNTVKNLLRVMLFAGTIAAGTAAQTVGYVNVSAAPGWNVIALPVHTSGGDPVARHFDNSPEGALLVRIVDGEFTTNRVEGGGWLQPDDLLETGEGLLYFNPLPQNDVVTFAGEILQGALTNSIPAGLSLRGGRIPRDQARLSRDQGLRLNLFDNVYLWKAQSWEVYTYLGEDQWHPAEPVIRVAEGFMVRAAKTTNSVVNLAVDPSAVMMIRSQTPALAAASVPNSPGVGTVNFANAAAGVLARVRSGSAGVQGVDWRAQLVRQDGNTSVILSEQPFATGALAGLFFGGRVNLPGTTAADSATFKVRVLRAGEILGESAPLTITLGGGIMPPANLEGLAAFDLPTIVAMELARENGEPVLKWPLGHADARLEAAPTLSEPFLPIALGTSRTNGSYLVVPIDTATGQRFFRLAFP